MAGTVLGTARRVYRQCSLEGCCILAEQLRDAAEARQRLAAERAATKPGLPALPAPAAARAGVAASPRALGPG